MPANSAAADIFRVNVRAILDEREMTITTLAEKIGTSRPTLSSILAGREGVTLIRAENIAKALGVDLRTLLSPDLSLKKKIPQPA